MKRGGLSSVVQKGQTTFIKGGILQNFQKKESVYEELQHFEQSQKISSHIALVSANLNLILLLNYIMLLATCTSFHSMTNPDNWLTESLILI